MRINHIVKPIILSGLCCMLLILLGSSQALAQDHTVSGTVTDAQTGDPLPSVNILVVGTSTGTATDADGHYSLEISSMQDTLRFSYIGYKTKTVAIEGRTTIDIQLQSAVIKGEGLVIIGYGTREQEELIGATGSVEMETVETLG